MLVIQEEKNRLNSIRIVIDKDEKNFSLNNAPQTFGIIKNIYLTYGENDDQLHLVDPYMQTHDGNSYGPKPSFVITNKNEKVLKGSYKPSHIEKIILNPNSASSFYAYGYNYNTPCINRVNLYENSQPQLCIEASSGIDWKGCSYVYKNKENELVVYQDQKELKRHKMNTIGAGHFQIDHNGELYLYQRPSQATPKILHKINKEGDILRTCMLPAHTHHSLRSTPGMLWFRGGNCITILNEEGEPRVLHGFNLREIKGAESTSSPDWAIYCYGVLPSKKDAIVKINLEGIAMPPQDYGLNQIKSIKTGPENTLYVHGSNKENQDAVFVVKNDAVSHVYPARPGFKIEGITSLESYISVSLALREFSSLHPLENSLNVKSFTTLCERLKILVPTYEEGQAFQAFFAPLVGTVQDPLIIKAILDLFQKYKETPLRGYVQVFEFEQSGGIDKVYKMNSFITEEKLLALAEQEDSHQCFLKTLEAEKQLRQIVNSISDPLKGVYNEHLESVSKAIEILSKPQYILS